MVNIHNPLTALLGWDKFSRDCYINSSNYNINSILLSEQQTAKICKFGSKQKGILLLCSTNARRLPEVAIMHFFTTTTAQNTLIKCKSDVWTYRTRHIG